MPLFVCLFVCFILYFCIIMPLFVFCCQSNPPVAPKSHICLRRVIVYIKVVEEEDEEEKGIYIIQLSESGGCDVEVNDQSHL